MKASQGQRDGLVRFRIDDTASSMEPLVRYVRWLEIPFVLMDAWYHDYERARDVARCVD